MPCVSPPAVTNSSHPETIIQRLRGAGMAGTYQPWYRRVRAPPTVPQAKPPRPSVSSHSYARARPDSSAADHSSGLRTLNAATEDGGWGTGCETFREDSLSNGWIGRGPDHSSGLQALARTEYRAA